MTEDKPPTTNFTWEHSLETYKQDKQNTPKKDWVNLMTPGAIYLMGRLHYAVLDLMHSMGDDGLSKQESIKIIHDQIQDFGSLYHHQTLEDDGYWYTELDREIFPDGDRLVIIESKVINPRWKDHTLMVTEGKYGGVIISEEVQENELEKLMDHYCDHPKELLKLLKKEVANNKNGKGRFGVFCREHGKFHEDGYRENNKEKGA